MKKFRDSLRHGQSLVEVLVALAVGSIFVIGAAAIIVPSLRSNKYASQLQVAAALGKELLENVRVFSEADWHNIYDLSKGSSNHYRLATTTSPFTAFSGDETIAVSTSTYTRYFYVENVSRDGSGYITASGGTNDPSTQKVSVVYQWTNGPSSTIATYLTRHANRVLEQIDWTGGGGQDGPATSTNNRFASSTYIYHASTTGSLIINPNGP